MHSLSFGEICSDVEMGRSPDSYMKCEVDQFVNYILLLSKLEMLFLQLIYGLGCCHRPGVSNPCFWRSSCSNIPACVCPAVLKILLSWIQCAWSETLWTSLETSAISINHLPVLRWQHSVFIPSLLQFWTLVKHSPKQYIVFKKDFKILFTTVPPEL